MRLAELYGVLALLHGGSGIGDAPVGTAGAIEYDDEFRSEFLQSYLEVLYQSIRCVRVQTCSPLPHSFSSSFFF